MCLANWCWLLASPQGCSGVLTMWQLAYPRDGDPRDHGGSGNVFDDPAWEITLSHFHSIPLATQSNPY